MKKTIALLCIGLGLAAQAKTFTLNSPDGRLSVGIDCGSDLSYTVRYDGDTVLRTSTASMHTDRGAVSARKAKGTKSAVNRRIASPMYRCDSVTDNYRQLRLTLSPDWAVTFRAYNDGAAYRWEYTGRDSVKVQREGVDLHFADDARSTVPYVYKKKKTQLSEQFFNNFQNTYTRGPLADIDTAKLMFLPLVVELDKGRKVQVMESDLLDYPGLFMLKQPGANVLGGIMAGYPAKVKQGGHNKLQMLVKKREDYVARLGGARSLPWRIIGVSTDDRQLAANHLTWLLGAPSQIDDVSWIKPGKVAWDWWSQWNMDGVDFETGVNTPTYKAYIDFAAATGIEYVILDEGWSVKYAIDLLQVVPEIDLPELVRYAKSKGVDLILWAGYLAFERDMENVCRHYADMGIKGFKIDFLDRDDQQMTDFIRRAAATCAKYKLVVDLHGTHKPAGVNRTWPNMLNFEGVHGLEQMKWRPDTVDQVTYDCTLPYIRQAAGPMDYTQGAMRNAAKGNYYPCYGEPMSQGTRCRQLALYMIFDAPLNMLCDSPSNYLREGQCTDFIAGVPTVWDETRVLDGIMGEYIVTARRSGNDWYVGGITDWNARDYTLALDFLPPGSYDIELFADGCNAHRSARDYRRSTVVKNSGDTLPVHMAPGGGFALKITRK